MATLRTKPFADGADGEIGRLPTGFFEARIILHSAISDCEAAAIESDAIVAALMSEALPRLVARYGPDGCGRILNYLTGMIETGCPPSGTPS